MRRAGKRVLALFGAGAMTLTMMGATTASADPGSGKGQGQEQAFVRHEAAKTKAAQERVRDYWTPERMATAIPREASGPAAATNGNGKGNAGKGKPGGSTNSAAAVLATPRPEFGKVFFTLGGSNYVCSGTVTRSTNADVVTTAGHCLNEGPGAFATNFAFVPAYDNNSRPYGTWVAESLFTTNEWRTSGDFNHDVGFAVMAEQGGRSIADVTGDVPIGFNMGYGLTFDAYGYPAAKPYDGQKLWRCSGVAGRDTRGTDDHRLPCSMTGGSSGGGWITGGVLNSVNSFGYRGEKDVMYGPYFGDVAQRVYATASTS